MGINNKRIAQTRQQKMQNIPKTTKGVLIQQDGSLAYGEVPLPELTDDQVLVKVHSAPIHRLDHFILYGIYPFDPRPKPCHGGSEGSGLVIATGSSDQAKALLNQRVSFFTAGSFAEYCVVPAISAVPLPENIDYEQGSMYQLNPLTTEGILHTCDVNKYTAIANSAAASQLGRMLLKGAKERGITVVNFVRREAQVKILKDLGAEFIINRGEEGWEERAEKVLEEQKVQAYFDALSGPDAGKIFSVLPLKTDVYNYGKLTDQDLVFDPYLLTTKLNAIRAFDLYSLLVVPETAAKLIKGAFEKMEKGTISSTVADRYPHEKFAEALEAFKEGKTSGKVLIQNPNFGQ